MANLKISELSSATTPLNGADVVPVLQGGANKKTTIEAIRAGLATAAQGAKADTAVQPGSLATVATSGSYADLSGKPTLGSAAGAATTDFATAAQGSKADTAVQPGALAAVATSGKYSDLTGRPTLGTAAAAATTDFATAAQGSKADTAVQPGALAAIATTGAYSDLSGKPTLGTAAATNASAYATAAQGSKADSAVQPGSLATVATSGSYADLSSKPSIPSLSDATPQAPGTAAAGTATSASRSDHVHALPGLVSSTSAGLAPASGGGTSNFLRADGTWTAPPAGSPGGSSGQLQWNSSGSFAGLSTSSIDGSGNMTFSARWIQSVNGAASAPPLSLTGTWFTGGTATTTKPHVLIEPAGTTSTGWSTSGTGLGVNAASGFAGNLLDLQVNGTRCFSVNNTGELFAPSGFRTSSTQVTGLFGVGTEAYISCEGNVIAHTRNSPAQLRLNTNAFFAWSSAAIPWQGATDLLLGRDAANTLAQRNGTNAQTFRLYNTFTSATNFERLNVRWAGNEAIIDTEAGSGGGTLRGLKIGSAGTSLLGFYGATPAVQPTAVADATDAATVITQLNALLSRLRTIGLIAT